MESFDDRPTAPTSSGLVLLVEDDPQAQESMRRILEVEGFDVITASNGEEALAAVRPDMRGEGRVLPDVILTDVRMPKMTGLEFVEALKHLEQEIPFVLMTAFGNVEEAVWAMKLGAVDFLTKPFRRSALREALERALKRRRIHEVALPSSEPQPITGVSRAMAVLRSMITTVAQSDATVLITGESGSGKELIAREIHAQSARRGSPYGGSFVAVNCAAIPENLVESELFGSEKGAFSGADSARRGLIESASRGTLFLDEIGEMPLSVQPKLLRFLEDHEVRRVGGTEGKRIDVRVLAATHRNLRERVEQGLFREDLFFRIGGFEISVPPLRDRLEDVVPIARTILARIENEGERGPLQVEPDFWEALEQYHWPGNVRELVNALERAVVLGHGGLQGGPLTVRSLPAHIQTARATLITKVEIPIGTKLREAEQLLIERTLEKTGGDKELAARLLGINPRTIYRRLPRESEPS